VTISYSLGLRRRAARWLQVFRGFRTCTSDMTFS
jgi:hypothetical protein